MNFRLAAALAALGALAGAFATPAQAHNHDATKKCGWTDYVVPRFVTGQTAFISSGQTLRRSVIFGEVIGIEAHSVVVLPGYQFGFAYAMDRGVPGNSTVAVACARSSVYWVTQSQTCCAPATTVTPKITGWLRVRARVLNAPGEAFAAGSLIVQGENTGVKLVVAAAVSTDPNDGGTTIGVEVPGPGDTKFKTSFTVDFDDDDESVDEATAQVSNGTFSFPDEEYWIDTDLDLKAKADGAPWDEGAAAADLTRHGLLIETVVGCTHCGESASFSKLVNAASTGTQENTP